jgi:hypothetical protein
MKKIKKGESVCTSQAMPAWLRFKVLAQDKLSGLFNEIIVLMTTVVKIIKHFFFIIDRETEKGRVFVPCK